MNSTPPLRRALLALCLAFIVMALFTPAASAASVLPAWELMDIVHDRARLIQFSIGAVAFGIALLWWGNKTN